MRNAYNIKNHVGKRPLGDLGLQTLYLEERGFSVGPRVEIL
jgi:hypothetical protein